MTLIGFQLAEGATHLGDSVPSLREGSFGFIRRVAVNVSKDEGTTMCVTYSCGMENEITVDISVTFYCIGQFELPWVSAGGEIWIPTWEIYDARDRGLERINFLVRDVEEELPEFGCEKITIRLEGSQKSV